MINNIGGSQPQNQPQFKPAVSGQAPKSIETEKVQLAKETKTEKSQEEQPKELNKEKMEAVVKSMNDFLKSSNTHLKFEFHDELKEYFVAIVDNETDEVVREIPSKKMLDIYAAMTEYLGLLVDKKI